MTDFQAKMVTFIQENFARQQALHRMEEAWRTVSCAINSDPILRDYFRNIISDVLHTKSIAACQHLQLGQPDCRAIVSEAILSVVFPR